MSSVVQSLLRIRQGKPLLLRWRSHPAFAIGVVSLGLFVDMCIYGIMVPVLPFALPQRFGVPQEQVPSRSSFLVACYAAGLLISAPVYAVFGEVVKSRRLPMVLGLIFLVASTIFLMLATKFWMLVVARIWQGLAGSAIWTAGLVLLADSVPKERVGLVMGTFCLTSWTVGGVAGPPIGGALYDNAGYKASFIFCVILVGIDLICRIFIIEKHEAARWAIQESAPEEGSPHPSEGGEPSVEVETLEKVRSPSTSPGVDIKGNLASVHPKEDRVNTAPQARTISSTFLPLFRVFKRPRALVGLWLTFVRCFILATYDTVLPLYLHDAYGLSSEKVGIIQLAPIFPVFLTAPLGGHLSDKFGARYVSALTMACCVPAIICLGIPMPLYGTVILLAVQGAIATMPSPCTLQDLTIVVHSMPGTDLLHVYSLWYMAFAAAFLVGPLVTAQLYHQAGWLYMSVLLGGLCAITAPLCLIWTGDEGGLKKDWQRWRSGDLNLFSTSRSQRHEGTDVAAEEI